MLKKAKITKLKQGHINLAARLKFELARISKEEMINEIDMKRILWRGDAFEHDLLTDLANIKYENGYNLAALRNYKEALKSFPTNPESSEISKL